MRIAFVSFCGSSWGGSEMLWSSAAKQAVVDGHQVLVSVFQHKPLHPCIYDLKETGVKLVLRRRYFPLLHRRIFKKIINLFMSPKNEITYHDYLKYFKCDHVFFNLAGGDEIIKSRDDLMILVRNNAFSFSVFYHSVPLVNNYDNTDLHNFNILMNYAKYNFFTSLHQVQSWNSTLGLNIPNVKIVQHPLSFNRFDSTHLVLDKCFVHFCIIGNLITRWKGQDMVIRILSGDKWRNRKWKLHLIGDGPDKQLLMKMAEDVGIQNNIYFYGYQRNVQNILAAIDLVLIPSRQDSGPIVMLESMFVAKPVVGTPMGFMPERIHDGINGILAKGFEEFHFAEAMEIAWQNKEKWIVWGQNAKENITHYLDPNPAKTLLSLIIA